MNRSMRLQMKNGLRDKKTNSNAPAECTKLNNNYSISQKHCCVAMNVEIEVHKIQLLKHMFHKMEFI